MIIKKKSLYALTIDEYWHDVVFVLTKFLDLEE